MRLKIVLEFQNVALTVNRLAFLLQRDSKLKSLLDCTCLWRQVVYVEVFLAGLPCTIISMYIDHVNLQKLYRSKKMFYGAYDTERPSSIMSPFDSMIYRLIFPYVYWFYRNCLGNKGLKC